MDHPDEIEPRVHASLNLKLGSGCAVVTWFFLYLRLIDLGEPSIDVGGVVIGVVIAFTFGCTLGYQIDLYRENRLSKEGLLLRACVMFALLGVFYVASLYWV